MFRVRLFNGNTSRLSLTSLRKGCCWLNSKKVGGVRGFICRLSHPLRRLWPEDVFICAKRLSATFLRFNGHLFSQTRIFRPIRRASMWHTVHSISRMLCSLLVDCSLTAHICATQASNFQESMNRLVVV